MAQDVVPENSRLRIVSDYFSESQFYVAVHCRVFIRGILHQGSCRQ